MRTLFVVAFVVAFAVLIIPTALSLVVPALRTGVLQARGRIYERSVQPLRFWFGIAFWLLMMGLSLLLFISMLHFEFGLLR